uniref:Hexosyltransferase n=1 Tax=Trypanosoma brucei brucei (strain 927/4 GUTat10.1) TaxID=185431 RepID=Q4FKT3_TRYB2|nr:hypothetical protein, conserved [Trypanosoma brucei brucei TREU927]
MRFVYNAEERIGESEGHFVVAGIPSIDNDERFRRRKLQRETCWSYSEVARKVNNFTGKLLIIYALSPHTNNNCELRNFFEQDEELNQDVIILPVCDVNLTTNKKIGDTCNWGWEAELTMSRKTYMWFKFAVEIFKPSNHYIMKADDDIFMRVPLYLKHLEVPPREKLNMGRAIGYYKDFSNEITWHTIGYASTPQRDVVKEIVDYESLKKLIRSPIKFRNFEQYMDFRALNEDIMVGEVIRIKLKFKGLLTVDTKDCHYVMYIKIPLFHFISQHLDVVIFYQIALQDYIHIQRINPVRRNGKPKAQITTVSGRHRDTFDFQKGSLQA